MKRPEQHFIDSAGQRLLHEVLESLGWVVRDVMEQDYGIDFDVEVFRRTSPGLDTFETTGVTFKAQLKSSKATAYSAAQAFISETISASNLRYLAQQLTVPTVIFHADVGAQRLYWYAPQLDQHLERVLAERSNDAGSITVRISTVNVLPTTTDRLLDAVASAATILAGRSFASVSHVRFFETVIGRDNAELLRAMQQKTDMLTLAEADRLIQEQRDVDALALLDRIFKDPTATVQTK